MYSCTKDEQPTLIETQKACWEIDDWTGLLIDSLMLTEEEPSIPEVDPAYLEWLNDKNNRVDIRSLTSENFEDLQCLKQYIDDRTIVQLGESSHGTKEYNLMKVRLIKFLHQEMGFEVIAFESGFFECNYIFQNLGYYTPEEAIVNSVYGNVWVNEEVLNLFEYIYTSAVCDNPLILSGFDNFKTTSILEKRADELSNMLGIIDSTYAQQIYEFDIEKMYLFGSYATDNYREDSDIDVAIVVTDLKGDFFSTRPLLWKLRRQIDDRIEPIVFERNNDKSGFLEEIEKHGIEIKGS